MMNCSLTVWHFSLLVCYLWDDAVGLPAFQKQLIFFGTALRSLPRGGLISASREEHIDCYFIVRKANVKSNVLTACFQKNREKNITFKTIKRHKYQAAFS